MTARKQMTTYMLAIRQKDDDTIDWEVLEAPTPVPDIHLSADGSVMKVKAVFEAPSFADAFDTICQAVHHDVELNRYYTWGDLKAVVQAGIDGWPP